MPLLRSASTSSPAAEDYPECLSIIRHKVKPERDHYKRKLYREHWWQHAEKCLNLYRAITGLNRVLLRALTGKHHAFAFVPNTMIFDQTSPVFVFDSYDAFAILQSDIHMVWWMQFAATLGTTLRYAPTDCFETFPFPLSYSQVAVLGESYYEKRNEIMVARQYGLTKLYNQFHNSDERSHEFSELRALHAQMDNAVADAYGWGDLKLGHGFHETKQGIRLTMSEPARREVLARLLKLNHERYAEEVAQGLHEKKNGQAGGAKRAAGKARGKSKAHDAQLTLGDFAAGPEDEKDEPEPKRSAPKPPVRSDQSAPSIEALDYDELIQAIRTVAASNGELSRDEFIVAVARELGYARTGSKIHDAVDGAIRAAARRGIVETGSFGVARGKVNIGDWSRDDLVDALCSVMRKGSNYEREDAIKLAAAHLGFKRVGPNIDEAFRSAINGGIRRQVIGKDGHLIWREE
jgi:hypothetical protein